MKNNILVKDHVQVIQRNRFEWECPSCEKLNIIIKNGGDIKYLSCEKCCAEIRLMESGDWVAR